MTEKYVELYKKYRPRVWEDVIGQDKVTENLRQIAISGEIPTSFMFFGTHGCGKTTSAFILAKALNCENPFEGNPCNECKTCKAIDNNSQMGVNYMSAANNGSVDAIRKLTNDAQIAQPIKQPVWIIDEVHGISKAAFESLLIPLESESAKALYIFCSTEPEKIPSTILSRVQVRTFFPVPPSDIAVNLKRIIAKEGADVSDEEIVQIVRASNGSVRDSIRDLETVIQGGELPEQFTIELLKLLVSKKYTEVYKLTSQMQAENQSFNAAAMRLYSDLSSILLIQSGSEPTVMYPGLEEIAGMITPAVTIQYLNSLGETIETMSNNIIDNRILFEIGMSKIITIRREFERREA